jgi:hypothetical protein
MLKGFSFSVRVYESKRHSPRIVLCAGLEGTWKAVGINPVLLFGRYTGGAHFSPHTVHFVAICLGTNLSFAICVVREILESEINFWQMQFAQSILQFAESIPQMAIVCARQIATPCVTLTL